MVETREFVVHTTAYNEWIPITADIRTAVERSKITDGMVFVVTMHTTTGITINENLECLLDDISVLLAEIAPEQRKYSHARVLPTYGTTAGNPTGHIKSFFCGNSVSIPLKGHELYLGSAQEVFLLEADGAQSRTVTVTIVGE